MSALEIYDLNEKLAEVYMHWQKTYFRNMPPMGLENSVEYADRMCCIAFMEGAKAVQLLMQQAFMDALAEQSK